MAGCRANTYSEAVVTPDKSGKQVGDANAKTKHLQHHLDIWILMRAYAQQRDARKSRVRVGETAWREQTNNTEDCAVSRAAAACCERMGV